MNSRNRFLFALLRILLYAAGVFFLAMIYWSLNVQEKRWIELEEKVQRLAQRGGSLQREAISVRKGSAVKEERNLLKADPFYEEILPTLLPEGFVPHGTRRQALFGGKPDTLHPFNNWAPLVEVMSWAGGTVASSRFGVFETLAPGFAESMIEEEEGKRYRIRLRENLLWAPLQRKNFPDFELDDSFLQPHPLTASDFAFWIDVIKNPYVAEAGAVASRGLFQDLDRIEVISDLEFIVHWKERKYLSRLLTGSIAPLDSTVYARFPNGKKILEGMDNDPLVYQKSPLFAQNFSQHWAKNVIPSSGPYYFDEMNDREIRLKRNPYFYNPLQALYDEIVFVIKESPENGWISFKEGSLDTLEVQPMQLEDVKSFLASPLYQKQAEAGKKIRQLDYVSRAYIYIGWNQKNPLFTSKKVRQALTMALDRERIIRDIYRGEALPIHGSFYLHSPSNSPGIQPWPFDPLLSQKILQEEGWKDTTGDGILDKEGGKFSFTLTYNVKSPNYRYIAEYVKAALQKVGIEVKLFGVDLPDLAKVFDDKQFDALLMGWVFASPPEDPRQLWYSAGAYEKGSSNMVSFENKEADRIIDQLDEEFDPKKRLALYHAFDAILHQEQPYTFLLTPKANLLYRERIKNLFIPADRKDLIPDANIGEPDLSATWVEP